MVLKRRLKNIIIHVVLIVGSISMLFPFLWMVLTSIKTFQESLAVPPTILPETPMFSNYSTVWNMFPFFNFYINTFALLFFRILFSVLFSAMAGYGFSRIKFPGRNVLFMLVLLQMMVPGQIFTLPQYLLVAKLGWLNTIRALILPGVVSTYGTFLLRQFFMGLPAELEEAAILDGCNKWQIFWKIMIPLAKSGLFAFGIFTALFAWKDLMWPLIVNMDIKMMTLSSGLASLQGQYSTNYPQLMAGAVIAIWPMIVIFALFQKQFIQGISTTGSKN